MFFLFSVYNRFLLVYILGAGLLTSALSVLMLYFLPHLLVSNSEPIYIVAMVRMIWKLSLVPIILVVILAVSLRLRRSFWHGTLLITAAASINFIYILWIFPVYIFDVLDKDCWNFALFVNAMLYALYCAMATVGFIFLLPEITEDTPLADEDLQRRINRRYGLFIVAVCLFSGASGGMVFWLITGTMESIRHARWSFDSGMLMAFIMMGSMAGLPSALLTACFAVVCNLRRNLAGIFAMLLSGAVIGILCSLCVIYDDGLFRIPWQSVAGGGIAAFLFVFILPRETDSVKSGIASEVARRLLAVFVSGGALLFATLLQLAYFAIYREQFRWLSLMEQFISVAQWSAVPLAVAAGFIIILPISMHWIVLLCMGIVMGSMLYFLYMPFIMALVLGTALWLILWGAYRILLPEITNSMAVQN